MGEIYSKTDHSSNPSATRQQAQSMGGRGSSYPTVANVAQSAYPVAVNSGARTATPASGGGAKYEHYRRDGAASQHGPSNPAPPPQVVQDPHLIYSRNPPGVAPAVVAGQQFKPDTLVPLTQTPVGGSNSYMTTVAGGGHRVAASSLQGQAPLLGTPAPPQPSPCSISSVTPGVQQQSYSFNHHAQKRPQLNPNKRHRIDLYGGLPMHAQASSHREPHDNKMAYGSAASGSISLSQVSNSDVNSRYPASSQPPPPRESAYHPQVEAISPALEDVRVDPILMKEKSEVADTLSRMEREITNTDKQLKTLRSKQALLESRINQQGQDQLETSDDEDVMEERRFHNPFEKVTAENRQRAKSSAKQLEDHLRYWRPDPSLSVPLYHQPSDIARIHEEKKRYKQFKPRLIEWLARRQAAERKRLVYLSTQYDKFSRSWVKKQEKFLNSHKRRNKEIKWRECFEKNFPDVKKNREEYERWKQEGFEMNDEYASNAFLVYHDVDKMKDYAIDPPITLPPWRRKYRYTDRNGIVRDPLQQHKTAQDLTLKWTPQERAIFKDRYVNFPKNFGAIASYLDKKTVADCIQFYYLTKKSENYKQLVKRHHSKRRRVQQERQLQRQQQGQQPQQQLQPQQQHQQQQQPQPQQQPQQPQQQPQQQQQQSSGVKQEKTEVMDISGSCSSEALKGVHKREPDNDDDGSGAAGGSGGGASNGGKSFAQNSSDNNTVNSLKIKSSPSSNSDRADAEGHTPTAVEQESGLVAAANDAPPKPEVKEREEKPDRSGDGHSDLMATSASGVSAPDVIITGTSSSLMPSGRTASSPVVVASDSSPMKMAKSSAPVAESRPAEAVDTRALIHTSSGDARSDRERKISGSGSSRGKSPEKSAPMSHDRNTISDLIQNAIENNLSMDAWMSSNLLERMSPKRVPETDARSSMKEAGGSAMDRIGLSSMGIPPLKQPAPIIKEVYDKPAKWYPQPAPVNGPPVLLRPEFPPGMAKLPTGSLNFVHSHVNPGRQLNVPTAGLHPSLRTSPLRVDTGQDVTDGASIITRHSPGSISAPRPSPQAPGGASFLSPVAWSPSSAQSDLSDPVYRMRNAGVPNYPTFSAALPPTAGQSLNPHIQVSEHGLFNRSVLVSDFAPKGIVSKLSPQRPVTHLTPSGMHLQSRLQPEYYVSRALDHNMLPQPQPMKPLPTSSSHHPQSGGVRPPPPPTIPSALIGPPRTVSHNVSHIQTPASGMCITLAQPTPTHLSALTSTHKPALPLPTLQSAQRPLVPIDPALQEAIKQASFNAQAEMRYQMEVEPFLFRDRSDSERTRTSSEASQIYDLIKRRPRGGGSGMPSLSGGIRQPPNGAALASGSGLLRSQEQTQMPPPTGVPQRSSSFSRKPEFATAVSSSSAAPQHPPPPPPPPLPPPVASPRDPASHPGFESSNSDLNSNLPTPATSTTTSAAAAAAAAAAASSARSRDQMFSQSHEPDKSEAEPEESSHEAQQRPVGSSRASPRLQTATPTSSKGGAGGAEKPITAASLIDAIIVSQISQPEGSGEERAEEASGNTERLQREAGREVERIEKERMIASVINNPATTTVSISTALPPKKSSTIRPMQITLVDRINQVIAEDYGNSNVNLKEIASLKDSSSKSLHSSDAGSASHSEDFRSVRQLPQSSQEQMIISSLATESHSSGVDGDNSSRSLRNVDQQLGDGLRSKQALYPGSKTCQEQEFVGNHVEVKVSQANDEKRSHTPSRASQLQSGVEDHSHDFSQQQAESERCRSSDGRGDPSMEETHKVKESTAGHSKDSDQSNDYEDMPFMLHKRRKVYDQMQKSNQLRSFEAQLQSKMRLQKTESDEKAAASWSTEPMNDHVDGKVQSNVAEVTTSSMAPEKEEGGKTQALTTLNLLHHALSNKQPLSLVESGDQVTHDSPLMYRKRSNSDIGTVNQAVRRSDYERLRETTQRIAIVTKATSAIGGFGSNKVNNHRSAATAIFMNHVDPKIDQALEYEDPTSSNATPDQSASPKKAVGSLIVTSGGNNNESSTPRSSPDSSIKRRAPETTKSAHQSSIWRPPKKRFSPDTAWSTAFEQASSLVDPVDASLDDRDCEKGCSGGGRYETAMISDESESPSKFSVRPSSDHASDRASVGSCSSQDLEALSYASEEGTLQIDLDVEAAAVSSVNRSVPPALTAVNAPARAAAGFGDK